MAPSVRAAALAAAALLAPLACAQTITVDNATVAADSTTVSPAAVNVGTDSTNATAALFESEAVQLTDDVLANLTALNLTDVSLFTFDNSTAAVTTSKCKRSSKCKVFPGDAAYPGSLVWKVFGLLLGPGALIKTTPIAAPCYNSWGVYDAAECAFLTNNWSNDSYIHAADPTSMMWPLWQGQTCMPTDDPTDSCTLGGYPEYAVKATNVAQVQLAVNFARNANLRLVVRNTGHDFNGKSGGAGALSIWTHGLKQTKFFASLTQDGYTGPAFKVGTGVQAYELYEAANTYGVTAIGGEGRTVGVTGGYMLGGGHSPLSSIYGTGSDQILSMEVVLPNGQFVTASNSSNPDLFWALRGGGGSTFGVVTSLTLKVYPKIPVYTVSTWNFVSGGNVSVDLFWQGMAKYLAYMPTLVDAGTYTYIGVFQLAADTYGFYSRPFFGPNLTQAQTEALFAPLFADLAALGIPVNDLQYVVTDNFHDAWYDNFPLETVGVTTLRTGSRLWPRANFQPSVNETLFNSSVAAIRYTVESGATILGFNIKASPKTGYPASAVNPAWRKTVLHAIQFGTWDADATVAERDAASLKLTNDYQAAWQAVTPGAGAYMSEGDILEPNFQQSFYGADNYPRLYAMKQQLDPWGLFYAPTAVGSENWYVTGQTAGIPAQNGRLCKV